MTMTPGLLRVAAIAIAVAGAIDPALTSVRTVKPEVALVVADPTRDAALADRVARELARVYTVVRGGFTGAAAVVAVGTSVPLNAGEFLGPAFMVTPDPRTPRLSIDTLRAPQRVALHERVSVVARVRATAVRGRKFTVTLRRDSLVVDRITLDVASDDAVMPMTLGFVPTSTGAVPLVVAAVVEGADASARADFGVDVRDQRWAVLVFDRRPSWMSTFVRRALESDPRFVVTSRVATSRAVSAETGRPPAALESLPSLALFDVVIAGAPEELTDADVAGLEDFARRRGGAVALLMDQPPDGKPFERLAGVPRWSRAARAAPSPLLGVTDDAGALQASELAWPAASPPAATSLTRAPAATPAELPVWLTPIGTGQLLVSGALDAWRFRDANAAAFDRFWRLAVAEMASAAAPLSVTLDRMVVAPGEQTTLRVRGSDPFSAVSVPEVRVGSGTGGAESVEKGSDPLIPVTTMGKAPAGAGAFPIVVTVRAAAKPPRSSSSTGRRRQHPTNAISSTRGSRRGMGESSRNRNSAS